MALQFQTPPALLENASEAAARQGVPEQPLALVPNLTKGLQDFEGTTQSIPMEIQHLNIARRLIQGGRSSAANDHIQAAVSSSQGNSQKVVKAQQMEIASRKASTTPNVIMGKPNTLAEMSAARE